MVADDVPLVGVSWDSPTLAFSVFCLYVTEK